MTTFSRGAKCLAPLLALLFVADPSGLRAETRKFTSATGTTITAEPLSHDGAGTLTLKKEDGTTAEVPIDKLSADDQAWLAEWMTTHPAERQYHFKYDVHEKKLADLDRSNAGYARSKRTRWAYNVSVTNADRNPVSDLTIQYRVYMRDDVSGYSTTTGVTRFQSTDGDRYQQKEGEEKVSGEMRFNDAKQFLSASFDLDETRYSYYYSRSRSKDRLAGIIVRILDRTGRVIDTHTSGEKWLASVDWKEDKVPSADDDEVVRRPMVRPAPTPSPEVADKKTEMGGSRVSIEGGGSARPVKGSAAAAKALMLDVDGNARSVTFMASSLAGSPDSGAMPVYFTSRVSRDLGSRMAEVGTAMGVKNGGWPEGRDASLTWSASFDPGDGTASLAACALALDAVIGGLTLDPAVVVAAPLESDLSLGTLKQFGARLSAAAKDDACSVVLVGPGNKESLGDLLLLGNVDPLWRLQVIEAADLGALRSVARSDRDPKLQAALDEFTAVRMLIEAGGSSALKSPAALAALKHVLAEVPTHLSASTLLDYASGQGPSTLSLSGSYEILSNSADPFLKALRAHLEGKYSDVEKSRNSLSELRTMRPKMSEQVLDLLDRIADLEGTWRDYSSRGGQGPNSPLYDELRRSLLKVSKLADSVEAQM